ncbi:Dihydroorotate dehydrogenase (quinone), mitochondrial [Melipona quadrifasciata]|uniref:Dihydroorotate dehydrogenase (quinone), mitochondrial n=1 Tax=Melipona quadrifasciata TaxID=166423 RepID=A0A0M8ZW84_9HYME|nr:Dihydroorotate dehydrogenase (quinone), mitochondrial [Melipona quadrifasciata]
MFYGGFCIYQGDENFYNKFVMPLARLANPEVAHNAAVQVLKWGLLSTKDADDPVSLNVDVWGMKFKNPVGMAAGSVTPKPQPGNLKPRLFRLLEDNAVVNRYGFNSEGHDIVWERLQKLKKDQNFNGIVGVNLGKNKMSEDAAQDYIDGIRKFADVADYFVINVSSPNTPGLRMLQNKRDLEDLLTKINNVRQSIQSKQPLLLKLAPDLSDSEKQDIADVIVKKKSKVDGLVLCNTTVTRNNLTSPLKEEPGGLSGAPLADMSTAMISDMYKRTHGTIPIIGVGGIFTGADAYDKIKAGASLVQVYTSFTYRGPPVVGKIKRELDDMLKKDGLKSLKDAVGKDANIR